MVMRCTSQPPVPADISLNKYSLEFQYAELKHATNHFDPAQRLGKGAFGSVFRGARQDGTELAVKTFEVPEEGGFEEEVRVLSKFRHPNLVILMGFARHGSQRFLVYELLEGGDVHKRLHKVSSGPPFLWRARVSAAYDAACGLSHLHNSKPKAFHRDIKSANILLDRNGTAKMADFGLACLSHGKSRHVAMAGGTPGYACPLYAQRNIVTEGSEVYSFGVVLLEMLTASPPAWLTKTPSGAKEFNFLVSVICGDPKTALMLIDQRGLWPRRVAQAVVELALRCTQMVEEQRPEFAEIVTLLRPLRDAQDSCQAPVGSGFAMPPPQLPAPVGAAAMAAAAAVAVPAAAAAAAGSIIAAAKASPSVVHAPLQSGGPTLWSLECTFATGNASVQGGAADCCLARDRHTLVHRQEPGAPALGAFKVGRLFQEDFFMAMIPSEELRNMVSREHYHIWASEVGPAAAQGNDGRTPCYFFITNTSMNYTSVNGVLLDAPDKHAQLHEGDLIGLGRLVTCHEGTHYTPIVQFRFDLSGSILRDGSLCEASRPPMLMSVQGSGLAREAVEANTNGGEGLSHVAIPRSPAGDGTFNCTSLAGDVLARFVLELGGKGLREEVSCENKYVVHGPPQNSEPGAPFMPLTIGRGHSTRFWQRILHEEAFQALSREHVIFEQAGAGVAVRNLSSLRPVRVCASEDDEIIGEAGALRADETRELCQGDVIVLNANRASSLWLIFTDLEAPQVAAVRQSDRSQAGKQLLKRDDDHPLSQGAIAGGA